MRHAFLPSPTLARIAAATLGAMIFLTAEWAIFPAGRSRDRRRPNGAKDDSSRQQSLSLSGGFDY